MQVKVLFFGQLKEVVGTAEEQVQLAAGAAVGDLLALYRKRFPRWEEFQPSVAVAVNQEYADSAVALKAGDEVAFLPPVSGGTKASRVELVRTPIDTRRVVELLKTPGDGAVAYFEGIVRNNSLGRQTLYLDYEAYEPMALAKMREIVAGLYARFSITSVALVHRLGRLQIGETSVLVGVSSPHRAAAFDACRHAVEQVKRIVPIWKKEYFADGAVWVEGYRPGPAVEDAPVRQES